MSLSMYYKNLRKTSKCFSPTCDSLWVPLLSWHIWASQVAQVAKHPLANAEDARHTHTQKSLSRVRLFVTSWIVAHQAPRSMGFSGMNIGVGCRFLLQGIFLTQGSNPVSRIVGRCFTVWVTREVHQKHRRVVVSFKRMSVEIFYRWNLLPRSQLANYTYSWRQEAAKKGSTGKYLGYPIRSSYSVSVDLKWSSSTVE